jgi:predicted nucleic acid-binding protein
MSALWEEADRRVSSRLLYPEARAALAAAERARRLERSVSAAAHRELERLWDEIDDVALSPELTRRAGDLSYELALTGGDAVHLATAEALVDSDDLMACTDARLASGARTLGLAVAGPAQSSAG